MAEVLKNKQKDLEKKSKSLSWLLRHGAPEVKINIDKSGLVLLSDIHNFSTKHENINNLESLSLEDFKTIVNQDKKNRYTLVRLNKNSETFDNYMIRANQGHSFSVPDLPLEEVDPAKIPIVVHGTDPASWKLIQESKCLNKMSREYMHFTTEEEFNKLGRKASKIVLKFDTSAAFKDGIKFYCAANNVILCKGLDGKLDLKYLTPKCQSEYLKK
jgi:RNA:NAD 2'-phosphotransferase (TPT1/KptA family)